MLFWRRCCLTFFPRCVSPINFRGVFLLSKTIAKFWRRRLFRCYITRVSMLNESYVLEARPASPATMLTLPIEQSLSKYFRHSNNRRQYNSIHQIKPPVLVATSATTNTSQSPLPSPRTTRVKVKSVPEPARVSADRLELDQPTAFAVLEKFQQKLSPVFESHLQLQAGSFGSRAPRLVVALPIIVETEMIVTASTTVLSFLEVFYNF